MDKPAPAGLPRNFHYISKIYLLNSIFFAKK